MKKLLVLVLMSLFAVALTACETTEGFGRDVEKVGEEIEEAADK